MCIVILGFQRIQNVFPENQEFAEPYLISLPTSRWFLSVTLENTIFLLAIQSNLNVGFETDLGNVLIFQKPILESTVNPGKLTWTARFC